MPEGGNKFFSFFRNLKNIRKKHGNPEESTKNDDGSKKGKRTKIKRPFTDGDREKVEVQKKKEEQYIIDLKEQGDWFGQYPTFMINTNGIVHGDLLGLWEKIVTTLMADPSANVSKSINCSVREQRWFAYLLTASEVVRALIVGDKNDGYNRIKFIHLTGSVAKGTAVDHKMADIDLVVSFKNFTPEQHDEYLEWSYEVLEKSGYADKISMRTFCYRRMCPVECCRCPTTASAPSLPGCMSPKNPEHSHDTLTTVADTAGIDSSDKYTSYDKYTVADNAEAVNVADIESVKHEGCKKKKRHAKYIFLTPESVRKLPEATVNVKIGSEFTSSAELFGKKYNQEVWPLFGATCSVKIVEFIRQQPLHVLVAIRALKSWRDACGIRRKDLQPSSCLLELICIWVAEHTKEQTPQEVFKEALKMLGRPVEDWNIYWTKFYDESKIHDSIAFTRPLCLDPLKPWHNTVRKRNLCMIRPKALAALAVEEKFTKFSGEPRDARKNRVIQPVFEQI
jgi:hypothetical protein